MSALQYDDPTIPDQLTTSKPGRAGLIEGVLTGTLVGFSSDGQTPLVIYDGQPGTAALPARSIVDLYGKHIGRDVVLMFERGYPETPIIMGWLRESEGLALPEQSDRVQVDVDGQRMVITAKEQLVLRCGDASITLTKAGKVLIRGSYVSSRASGVNRVQGCAVQIN